MLLFLKDVLFYLGLIGLFVSLVYLAVGFFDWLKLRSVKRCTSAALGVITDKYISKGRDGGISTFDVEFLCNGQKVSTRITFDLIEGYKIDTAIGTEVPIYYDPKEPTRAIISEDPNLTKTRKSSQSFNKWILRIMFLSIALMVCALMIPNLLVTTVRELDQDYRSLADEKPQLLRYSQSIDGTEILNIEINDETLVKESLVSIVEIKVSKMGEYIDMYRPDYRDFVFVFGSGELSFHFVGDSYFSYDGCYYEIKESKLAELISDIYTQMTETQQ